jgi:large subunit ribosomal protein L3
MKRHGFSGGWGQHGQKHSAREAGSIGSTGQQRVNKGKRMAGRMGSDRITQKSVTILDVDVANGLILVKGAVAGKRGTVVEIKAS